MTAKDLRNIRSLTLAHGRFAATTKRQGGPMTTHEVLVEMRNGLARRGWCQESLGSPRDPGCLWGAAIWATRGDDGSMRKAALGALVDALGLERPGSTVALTVAVWNDENGRTENQVLTALDEAIAATAPAPADPFEGDLSLSGNGAQHPGPKADIPKVLAHRE